MAIIPKPSDLRKGATDAPAGDLASAFIAGLKKCGTTCLFRYLSVHRRRTWLLLACVALASIGAEAQTSGIVAIWPGDRESSLNLPYVSGGQVTAQWLHIEPSPGVFDWARLENGLDRVAAAGSTATIQINTLERPDWLFDLVPSLTANQLIALGAGHLAKQTANADGLPMHWHPAYIEAHERMIEALAQFVKNSPLRKYIFGVRLNYNAVGTEITFVPQEIRAASLWNTPDGVTPGVDWTKEIDNEYSNNVIDAYLESFEYNTDGDPIALVYVRPVCIKHHPVGTDESASPCRTKISNDERIGIFHTSGAPQPHSDFRVPTWAFFREMCSSGNRQCYAEGLQQSTNHPVQEGVPLMTDAQYDYWRNLLDLSLGASIIADRTLDLERAVTDPAFKATREFTHRYAGTHRTPESAPGGWIAFREGEFFKGDYGFLIQSDPVGEAPGYTYWEVDSSGTGADSRYGMWSRVLRPGNQIQLSINPALLTGLSEADEVEIRVVARRADTKAKDSLPLLPPTGLRLREDNDPSSSASTLETELRLRITGPPSPVLIPISSTTGDWTELVQPLTTLDPSVVNWTLVAEGDAVEIHLFELRRSIRE
jgi:hypothetical protein